MGNSNEKFNCSNDAGDIVTWFNRSLAGIQIDPKVPGFRRIVFCPRPVADLTHARASTHSPFGDIEAAWQIEEGTLNYAVTVPPNARATVILPDGSVHRISSGQYRFSVSQPSHRGIYGKLSTDLAEDPK
jgi:alpha-L-rhamnosidase